MAFGFGFNKQKALSAAEKFVQQGKLQNAIAEYEKVLKADPKELTVSNTIGDLYARLGQSDKAIESFKSVGDAYAAQGFTVKAIAMYKKLTKLKPTLEIVLRLAELYTQQGLFNDARAQYLQVAEEFLRSGELEQAVRIFQKTLEMDPENVAMRTRLAEVYIRLNKKTEAWQLFAAAADSLRTRGQLGPGRRNPEPHAHAGSEQQPGPAVARPQRIRFRRHGRHHQEPGESGGPRQSPRGPARSHAGLPAKRTIAGSGNAGSEVVHGSQRHGRDHQLRRRADGRGTLHRSPAGLSALFRSSGVHGFKQSYRNPAFPHRAHAGQHARAGDDPRTFPESWRQHSHHRDLRIARTCLRALRKSRQSSRLLSKAHTAGAAEPVAHPQLSASAGQAGRRCTGARFITAEEGAVLVEELEATAPFIDQRYPDDIALAVRAALTDAELFVSYNMPAKALGPLLSALPKAPSDLRLNQRLAALHTRAGRFSEAAVCCRNLEQLYHDAGHPDEATRYKELADKYEERTSTSAVAAVSSFAPFEPEIAHAETESFGAAAQNQAADYDATVERFRAKNLLLPDSSFTKRRALALPRSANLKFMRHRLQLRMKSISLQSGTAMPPMSQPLRPPSCGRGDDQERAEAVKETVEELRFYLAHSMPEQARVVFDKLEKLKPGAAQLARSGRKSRQPKPAPSRSRLNRWRKFPSKRLMVLRLRRNRSAVRGTVQARQGFR